jgi:hypothetical protein
MIGLPNAHALKEKNEALCGTGFFTNIGQWYCTDLGDISDEAASKGLSQNEKDSVDSLLSKFSLDSPTSEASDTIKREDSNKSSDQASRLPKPMK